jgi:amino acid transporter
MNTEQQNTVFVDSKEDGAQRRLEQLGYKQVLDRRLSITGNVVMALSNVGPLMAAFLYAMAAFATVGTATAPAALLQGINVIFIGLILAELGSIYPVSGGMYSIIKYVLPKPLAFVAVFTFMIQAFIYPPAISMGVGEYLQILFPQLPQTPLATSVLAAITLLTALFISVHSIATNNRVARIFLVMQMLILFAFIYFCFANPQRPLEEVVFSSQMFNAEGSLFSVGFFGILMGVGILCASIDGYGASLGFTEETKGSCRNAGIAQLVSAISTAVIVVTAIVVGTMAAPNIADFLNAPSPMLYTAEAHMGNMGGTLVNIGIIVASFGGLVVIINYMARVLFTGARDRVGPEFVNRALSKVSKRQTPYVATAAIALICSVLVFSHTMVELVTYGSMTAATVYLLIALGSINSRRKDPHITRPFRMPLYPLPPIIVSCFLVTAIYSQELENIIVVGSFVGVSLLYYFFYIKPRDEKEKTHE